ncbi:isopentenyl-diphosphate Delta-isomerase [Agromyces sp. NPDC058126]|uniref:isopentenyl-diphosphate Delta-isomerase n=1 Tax=Agromyces sp. NPDC058126 TaxID=3346350 RepID=UPI0036D9A94E
MAATGLEMVVLLDEEGQPIGTANKHEVHTAHTPLHAAFSCYVSNSDGQLLLTRRSLSKKTWPGVWTNSFCGHPGPGEVIEKAITRRARDELGISLQNVELILPNFRYRAVDAGGIVENEICPVYRATTTMTPVPVAAEIAEWRWVNESQLRGAVRNAPFAFSPWLDLQLGRLPERL